MKKVVFYAVSLIMFALLTFTACSKTVKGEFSMPSAPVVQVASPQKTILRLASAVPANSHIAVAIEVFAEEIRSKTNSQVQLLVYHEEFLGDETKLMQNLLDDVIDFALLPPSPESEVNAVLDFPYLVDEENISTVIEIIVAQPEELMFSSDISILNIFNLGPAFMTSERQLNTFFELAQQQGDKEVSPLTPIIKELPPYDIKSEYSFIATSRHRYFIGALCVKTSTLKSMSSELQDIITKAAVAADNFAQQEYIAAQQNWISQLKIAHTVYMPNQKEEFVQSLEDINYAFSSGSFALSLAKQIDTP